VRQLLRSVAALAVAVARAAFHTPEPGDPGAGRGTPAIEEARVVVTDEPSRGLTYGAGFNPGPVDDSFLPRPSLEGLEAECRIRMATVAGMPEPRGFDTGKAKARKRAELDETLDLYNLAVEALRENEVPT
jgi:hypothetical protein